MFLCEFLDNANIIRMSPFLCFGILFLASAVMGNLSLTDKQFDYLITVIMPLTFFCCMLIAGFIDKDDMETRFHFDRALKCAFQGMALLCYGGMGLITFLSSYKKIRIVKKLKSKSH